MTIFMVVIRFEYIENKHLRKRVIDETLYTLRTTIPRKLAEKYRWWVVNPLVPLRAREPKIKHTTTIIIPYYYAWRRGKVDEVLTALREELERFREPEWKEIDVYISQ